MVPIQLILLLLLVSAPSILAGDHPAPAPPSAGPATSAWEVALLIAGFLGVHLLLPVATAFRTRKAIARLHEPVSNAAAITSGIDSLYQRARWLTMATTGTFLFLTPLPGLLQQWHQQTHVLKYVEFLPELLLSLPALVAWLGFWTCSYYVELAARERSLPYRLTHELPAHEMPTLPQYLSMQCRHNFFILVPVLLNAAIIAIGNVLARRIPGADAAAVPVSIVTVFLAAPWLLVRIWRTAPLTGQLREKLDRMAAEYRLRFRNILLWKTHNAITNAAILGWVPFARYFLMTDALLESLSDRQLEAVFAHEVGHGVHRHILWYLAYFVGILTLATGLAVLWVTFVPGPLGQFAGGMDATISILSVLLLGLGMLYGFSPVSHRFENQADWFASRHMAKEFENGPMIPAAGEAFPRGLGHGSQPQPMFGAALVSMEGASPAQDAKLEQPEAVPAIAAMSPLQSGAEVFISALSSIVDLAQRSRDKKDWMHPSINQRIGLLRELASAPGAVTAFDRKMVRTRLAVAAILVAGVTTVSFATYLNDKYAPPAAQEAASHPAAAVP